MITIYNITIYIGAMIEKKKKTVQGDEITNQQVMQMQDESVSLTSQEACKFGFSHHNHQHPNPQQSRAPCLGVPLEMRKAYFLPLERQPVMVDLNTNYLNTGRQTVPLE